MLCDFCGHTATGGSTAREVLLLSGVAFSLPAQLSRSVVQGTSSLLSPVKKQLSSLLSDHIGSAIQSCWLLLQPCSGEGF